MSSKKYYGESNKKFSDSPMHTNEGNSRKGACNKRFSSPKPSSSPERLPAYYKDYPTSYDSQQAENLHSPQRKTYKEKNAPTETSTFNKFHKRNQRCTSPVYPELRSMPVHHQAICRQTQNPDRFRQDDHQRDFNPFGAKPKIYKDPKHCNFPNPGNHKLMHLQNKPPWNRDNLSQKNVKSHSLRKSDQHNRSPYQNSAKATALHIQQNFPSYNSQVKSDSHTEPLNSNTSHAQNSSIPYKKHRRRTRSNKQNYKEEKVNNKNYSYSKWKGRANYTKKSVEDIVMSNVEPLLSFQSMNEGSEKGLDLIQFTDDDMGDNEDWCIISQQPTNPPNMADVSEKDFSAFEESPLHQNVSKNTCDVSASQNSLDGAVAHLFDDESDSDLIEDTEESDLTSEYSVVSSVMDSVTKLNYLKLSEARKEAFVSVFWDIENCSLPQKKSAVDFASYIRGTFYEGRTEVAFTAACDVSNLSRFLVRDLEEAAITLIHISSLNKNAADKKIMSLLQRFQIQYRKSNSAVVLISSDSDFSQVLLDMRYQHHIFVNVICKSNTRDSLVMAANKYVFFDDVLNELPNRDFKNMHHVLIITNLPKLKVKVIKRMLLEKLRNFNCKLRFCSAFMAKVFFKDYSVCVKALNSLKGFYLGGNILTITYSKEVDENDIIFCSREETMKSLDINVKEVNTFKCVETNNQVHKESDSNKSATVCVVVSSHLCDVEHWKKEFENILNMKDFSINWDYNTFGGCFLIRFKSLKKAQRAKKKLQKNQTMDTNAPKFLKLIKNEEDLINIKSDDFEGINKEKIDEHLQIIEKKKLKVLRQFGSATEIKYLMMPEIRGTAEIISKKQEECREQVETFKNFCNKTTNAIKNLSCDSENLDKELKEILCDFIYECNCITLALPIYAKKEIILKKIRENQVIVICAETGSGKSTQLVQYIWRERNNFKMGKIICTQPRKISAITHAKHVSSQIGCNLGDIVGYHVGMCGKMSANTNILYVTDSTILKMLISEDLASISCIIIDEAHERTICTDILLSMIKQYLSVHPQLKVVITSATNDVSLFRDFFALTDDAVVCIPENCFPIEDEWSECDVTPEWDYFSKTIDTALQIFAEGPGDVVSFLTTSLETEKASEVFSKRLKNIKGEKSVKVFHLHENMNPEDQQKIFQNTPQGVRKVVFATSYAETSVTIPGIKYVIDCGMVKESKYDAVRNINILSVGFTSRCAVEQRRGRAGLTQCGKCYHLYSKKNYARMEANTIPEILRINLGLALLKLLKIGVKDVLQFDFIQSPSKELLTAAMNQLLLLKAVDENFILTDLGKNMAALPLEPQLGHLIFQGFENDVGYDALVIAALVSVFEIFLFNPEKKDEADKKKQFCEYESDFISYLEVYKEWLDIPKPLKSQWCKINCINACSLQAVHELVNEIILIIQKELRENLKLKLKFHSEVTTYDTLSKLIFYSFSQSLSVFSGHPKLGYMNLNTADQLIIHSSSSLASFGQSLPRFIVFDTILNTSHPYIVNVSPVTVDMISEAVNLYGLKIDLESVENLTSSELNISPIGEKIIFRHFIGRRDKKRVELQNKIKELIKSDFIEIDIDVSKGCIKFISFASHFDKIESLISPIILDAKQSLLNEEKDACLFEKSQFSAILAAGGQIHDVVLPGEFRDIKVILKGHEGIESVCEKLSLCGSITAVQEWKKYFKVTFSTCSSAKIAFDTYKNETEFSLQGIVKHSPLNERDCFCKVFMSFYRRPCLGVAYVSVQPKMSAFSLPTFITYENTKAKVTVCKRTMDIRITDLPANTDNKKLESIVSKILPSDVKIVKFLVIRKKPYESAKEEMELMRKRILDMFLEFTPKENVSVVLKKPGAKYCFWNAVVYFKNFLEGETAVTALKDRKCSADFEGGIVFKPRLQTFLHCKAQIFSVVKEKIVEVLEILKEDHSTNLLNINAIPKDPGTVEIQIISNNVCDITRATTRIYRILNGDQLKFPNNSYKIKLFSNSGKDLLKKLSLEFQDCYILQNEYNKTISLFGKEITCDIIKMLINEFLNDDSTVDFKELSLKTESGKSGVLKELLRKYGYDLQKLKEDCGISDIEINKNNQLVVIHGNSSSLVKCESVIQDIKEKIESADSAEVKGEICPVCCDEVSEDKHRLEYCGHAYCNECLLHLFLNSASIPLNCELCHDPIVMADILWAISGRKSLEKILFMKFLRSFVDRRSDVSFCPSQDCFMVFRVTKDKMNVFNCPLCGNIICTRCEDLYHFGRECNLA